ncbi:methyltransferase domain-containing protein [Halorubrum ezzemoulense]|uniref:class I SAM-dependent methyltransferase n=1 Tax=Halorubrum ezzemoulense TaxID=337243 RepID=UPI00233158CE|nr:methyltransferase domain-containing protein [Halorubrum ezzemoulense]MDB9279786.1 methyltransferase domain-containing protein [Halorubrum ezzemoulense]MDB9283259.1 methyltransferase domain-containing protein [Halorubrum ezzemoulense]
MAEDPAGGRRRRLVTRDRDGDSVVAGDPETDPRRLRRIRRGYDAWARVYDWFARATASVGGVRAACVRALDLAPGDTVVEFGCGPGVNLPALRDAVGPSGRVVGVDVSPRMLNRAAGLVERHDWGNVSLVEGDAERPPVAAADGVLATFVTSLFADPYRVVSRWCDLADAVVVAAFVPEGNGAANAALRAFVAVNGRLFDARGDDPLGRLAERTAAARRALDDGAAVRERDQRLFGTIAVETGRNR